MKINSVCLIRLPSEEVLFEEIGVRIPPFALGIITGYLRQRGIVVDQFDLMPRMKEIYGSNNNRKLFKDFFDKKMVFSYANGAENAFFDKFVDSLLKGIAVDKYDIIAFSVGANLSWIQTHGGVIFGEYISRHWEKLMVFGGINFTPIVAYTPIYDELLALYIRKFRYIIAGPGEESLYQLITALNAGKNENDIYRINGMCYLDSEGKIIFNKKELRKIIKPDFEGLRIEDYYNYLENEDEEKNLIALFRYPYLFKKKLLNSNNGKNKKTLVLPYIFNYNCPYNCAFCAESNPDSPAPVIGKVDQVVRDLQEMSAAYGTPYFYFINNAVNCSKKYVISLCRAVIESGLKIYWSDCARFNNVDYDVLRMMKQAGCQKLIFGMETGSPALIKRINKKIDLAFAEQVLAWCNEIGIWAELEIISGMPSETEDDFLENYKYIQRNIKNISYMTINHYILLPGTIMFRNPDKYNIEIGDQATYEDILLKDLTLLMSDKNPVLFNNVNRVFRYRDKGRRNFDEVTMDTVNRIQKMTKLMYGQLLKEVMKYVNRGFLKIEDIQNRQPV
jgi:radical SAM superfamily enzyme YgiQ (UPF0313 family)